MMQWSSMLSALVNGRGAIDVPALDARLPSLFHTADD
jgi:hypothetical protein